MKLQIAVMAASIILRWDIPGPGTCYLFSSTAGSHTVKVEAAYYVKVPSHAAFRTKSSETNLVYWTVFVED